jgi:hypothetical protein
MTQAILGPTLSDVQKLASGTKFTLASAFYSASRLDELTLDTGAADIMVRLDLKSVDAWVSRSIAPDALLRCWKRHPNVAISLYCSATAHAKVYAGDMGFLIGSANLTVRGLAGASDEVLWYESAEAARIQMDGALKKYKNALRPITMDQLDAYVSANAANVISLQMNAPRSMEDYLPTLLERPTRMGRYEKFLSWLSSQECPAAKVILERANGKANLSGHIKMNFYGIRQFLIANPSRARVLRDLDAGSYALCRDTATENALRQFVEREAADEGALDVDVWRTYLPVRSGGKPKRGGGTSGNLNRMLPLEAKYLYR